MNTQHTFMLKKVGKISLFLPPDLALGLTLISSNYPCLELIFMVPKVFEPLKFYCNWFYYFKNRFCEFFIRRVEMTANTLLTCNY